MGFLLTQSHHALKDHGWHDQRVERLEILEAPAPMAASGHFRPSSAKNAIGGLPPKSFRGRRVLMTEALGQYRELSHLL
jgi:hypothetical protein